MKGSIDYGLLKTYEGKGFRSETINLTLTTAGSPYVLIRNPNGSGKTMILEYVVFTAGGGTINDFAAIEWYKTPTVSANGTTVTMHNANIGSIAATATVKLYSAPTISADGTKIGHFKVFIGHDSVKMPYDGKVQLSANNDLYVKVTSSTVSVSLAVNFSWLEL